MTTYETQQFFGFKNSDGTEACYLPEKCSHWQFMQALTEMNRGFSHDGYFKFFIDGCEVADYLEAVVWGDYGVALELKDDIAFVKTVCDDPYDIYMDPAHVKPLRSDCPYCHGYGYTEAVSANWTDAQFLEFLCPHCEEETF